MLVLVATHQRDRNQHSTTVAGELVVPSLDDCSCAAVGCDGSCPSGRAWYGVASGGATRSAMVADRPGVRLAELRQILAEYVARSGDVDSLAEMVDGYLRRVGEITRSFPEGTLLERRGDSVAELRAPRVS